jgi:Flp pilus assembly protein TadB
MTALAGALAGFALLLAAMAHGLRPRASQRKRALLLQLAGDPRQGRPDPDRHRRDSILPAAVRARLDAAGSDWSDEAVILLLLGTLAGGFVLGQLILGGSRLAWLVTAAGPVIPFWFIGRRTEARRLEIQREAAEAVRALSRAVASGLPLDRALRRFADRHGGLLARETQQALAAMDQLGTPLETALWRLQRRLPVYEVRLTASLLRTAARGVHLAERLHDLAETLDDRARALAKARTALGEPRKDAVGIVIFPPAVCVILHLFSPSYYAILTGTLGGQIALIVGLGGPLAAYLWVHHRTTVHDRF